MVVSNYGTHTLFACGMAICRYTITCSWYGHCMVTISFNQLYREQLSVRHIR